MKFNVGNVVYFQFNDDGVVRDAVGTINSIESGGLYNIMFQDSNIIAYGILPATCRPFNFSVTKLKVKIRSYACAFEDERNSGRLPPEDAEFTKEHLAETKRELYKMIRWLE